MPLPAGREIPNAEKLRGRTKRWLLEFVLKNRWNVDPKQMQAGDEAKPV